MFNEARLVGIAVNKERQYRGKLASRAKERERAPAKEGTADRRNGRSATRN